MNKASRIIRIASAIGLVLALGLLAACAKTPSTSSAAAPERDAGSEAATGPLTVTLTAPTAGATVPAGDITVAVETTGLEFVMPGGENVAGQGHVHFTLDDRPEQMSAEKEAVIKDVEPGSHTLVAQLVGNDAKPLDPPVKQEIEFVAE